MKNTIQKTAVALLATLAIILVSGNVLPAQEPVTGDLVTAADLAFIKAVPTGMAAGAGAAGPVPSAGLISPADYAFVVRTYSASPGNLRAQAIPETTGLITAADYKFLTTGPGSDIFSAYSDFADSLAGRPAE